MFTAAEWVDLLLPLVGYRQKHPWLPFKYARVLGILALGNLELGMQSGSYRELRKQTQPIFAGIVIRVYFLMGKDWEKSRFESSR